MGKVKAFLYILLVSLLIQIPTQTQNNSNRLVILDVDPSQFPTVNFTARVTNETAQTITDLTSLDFNIGEAHEPSTVMVNPALGRLNTVIIVDRQPIIENEISLYRQFLNTFSEVAYQEGDNLHLMWVGHDTLTPINNTSQLGSFINSQQFQRGSNIQNLFTSVDRAVRQLQDADAAGLNTQIIILGSYLSPTDSFNYNSSIPIHTLQLHSGSRPNPERFSSMTRNGGRFFRETAINSEIRAFLNHINDQRMIYNVQYTSQQAAEGQRHITVSARGSSGALSYTFDVRPPVVEIIRNESGGSQIFRNVINEQAIEAETHFNYDKVTEEITARVTFPDGHIRPIVSGRLIVDGVSQTLISPLPIDPSTREFTLVWDVSQYMTDGTETVAVSITDQYNLSAKSPDVQYGLTVTVRESDNIVCHDEFGNLRPIDVCQQLGEVDSKLIDVENTRNISLITNIVMLIVVIALAIITFTQRKKVALAVESVGSMVFEQGSQVVRRVTKIWDDSGTQVQEDGSKYDSYNTLPDYPSSHHKGDNTTQVQTSGVFSDVNSGTVIQGTLVEDDIPKDVGQLSDEVRALFKVLKSPIPVKNMVMTKNMTRIIFGRVVEDGADISIPISQVSGQHFEVIYNHHEQTFSIKDERSSNHTYVDGNRVPRTEVPLQPGAMISLGKKGKEFLEMQFIPNPKLSGQTQPQPKSSPRSNKASYQLMDDDTPMDMGANDPTEPFTPVANYSSDVFDTTVDEQHRPQELNSSPIPQKQFKRIEPPPNVNDVDEDWLTGRDPKK